MILFYFFRAYVAAAVVIHHFQAFFLVWGKGKMVVLCYLGPSEVLPFFIEIIGDPSKIAMLHRNPSTLISGKISK